MIIILYRKLWRRNSSCVFDMLCCCVILCFYLSWNCIFCTALANHCLYCWHVSYSAVLTGFGSMKRIGMHVRNHYILFVPYNEVILFLKKKKPSPYTVYIEIKFLNSSYIFRQPPVIIREYTHQSIWNIIKYKNTILIFIYEVPQLYS